MHAGNHPPFEMTVKARKFRGLDFFRNSSLKFQKSGVLPQPRSKGKNKPYPARPTDELEPKERNPVNHQRRYWQVNCEKKIIDFMTAYDPKLYPFTASFLKRESKNGPFDIKHNLAWK